MRTAIYLLWCLYYAIGIAACLTLYALDTSQWPLLVVAVMGLIGLAAEAAEATERDSDRPGEDAP